MNKLTFKVSLQKDCSVVSLIKEVNKISCRLHLDLENGFVEVENINDAMVNTVIELVDRYYTILGVEIDNTSEKPAENQDIPVVTETIQELTTKNCEETRTLETVELVAQNQPTLLKPQSEDDLLIKKVEFKNEYVENLINKLLGTAAWAMFKMNIPEKEIGDFIYTSINEISMRYNKKECIEFSVGDIVDCNYGTHLIGEINGAHVAAIVCNISDSGMVYVVPITRIQTDITSHSYLIFNAPEDAIYKNAYYNCGTALLDKAKYVRAERFNAVIGKTTLAFFKKLLYQLASTFDFTDFFDKFVENEEEKLLDENCLTINEKDDATDKVEKESDETIEEKSSEEEVVGEEAALLKIVGPALERLDKSISVSEQVEGFLNEIGMSISENLVTQSFVIACDIEKINYANIVSKLYELKPDVKAGIIKEILKQNFKDWLKQYPELAEKYPKISLISLLKVFVKRFA